MAVKNQIRLITSPIQQTTFTKVDAKSATKIHFKENFDPTKGFEIKKFNGIYLVKIFLNRSNLNHKQIIYKNKTLTIGCLIYRLGDNGNICQAQNLIIGTKNI